VKPASVFSRAFLSLILISSLSSGALAQDDLSSPKWDFSLWTAVATGEENTDSLKEAQIVSAGVFAGRTIAGFRSGWFRGNLEYGLDVFPLFLASKVHGIGFDPVIVRWTSSRAWHRAMPYIELGGGGLATNANFPRGDTSTFNFVARGGGGMNILSGERNAIDVGCRWWHISNANLGTRNPEFNGIQFSLGYHWLK
jgi:hypothetical protein